ncbi:unnamed protein product, partial [Brenthis ino]
MRLHIPHIDIPPVDIQMVRVCPVLRLAGPTTLHALQGTGLKNSQLPNSGLLLRLTMQKDSIPKLGPIRDSNPGPPGVQPYMLATTPPKQSIPYKSLY